MLAGPCSAATSFRRAPATSADTGAAAATAARTNATTTRVRMSEDLVQNPDQPARLEVVLDETFPEVADLHLPHRGGRHHVARPDVGRAHDAGQHDELAVAVDVHLADALEQQVAVGQHLGDPSG